MSKHFWMAGLALAVLCCARGRPATAQTTIYPEADSEVRSGSYVNNNYGTSTTMYVREQTEGGSASNRAVLRFDLSSLSGTVADAKLRLYVYAAPSSSVTHRLYTMDSDSWVETTITWNNCPSTTSTTTTWLVGTGDVSTWKEIDVTALAAQEAAGDDKLSVMVMADAVLNVTPQYRSREASGTTYDPHLVVTVTSNQPPTAAAGSDLNVTDTDDSGSETVTLDGSGSSDSDGSIASYVWKEGTSQIATGQTAQHAFAVGTHTVTLTVTDDDGATANDTAVVTVEAEPTATTLHPEADAEVRYSYPNNNIGTGTTLYVREQAGGLNCNRAILRFDLSGISGTIGDARLRLYVNTAPASNVTHRLYFMSDDSWVETTVTWNTCPSATSTSTTWPLATTEANTWKEIDVTALAAQEAAGDDKLSVMVMADTVVNVTPQ